MIIKSIRISEAVAEKWQTLADQLGVSRNRAIGLLIEHAEVERIPIYAPVARVSVHVEGECELLEAV